MEGFLVLAGQLFLIVCIQSVLEVAAADRFQNHLKKSFLWRHTWRRWCWCCGSWMDICWICSKDWQEGCKDGFMPKS